jgi:ABC-type branched-subunit amino acid transport system substrate-binding protein
MKRCVVLGALAFALATAPAQAQQYSDGVIRIGVMNDMSGLYADVSGQGGVVAAKMAVEDFGAAKKAMKVEIVSADHQNKPDIGSNIARTWFDVDKVDVIVDVPTSSVALAITQVAKDKNKVFIGSGPASSDLTGKACNANFEHWTYDTWSLANGTGKAIVKTGGDTWFFITADYAFGHALERDTAAVVKIKPCAVCRPSECTSVMKTKSPARFCPACVMPNSAACLMELMVSPPALASPMIFAFDCCACSRNDEKSLLLIGTATWPSTLPPFLITTASVSRSKA